MNGELMKHVERAVRPVGTHHARRMQMREELYGLIEDIYEDERKQSDEETAVAAAIRRFGPAEDLTAELQSTLNLSDRVACFEERLLAPRQRPEESVLRHAARTARNTCLAATACGLPLLAFFRILGDSDDGERVMLALLIGLGCWVFLETLLGHATYRCFTRERWSASLVVTLALLQAVSGGLVLVIGFGVVWFSSFDLEAAMRGVWSWSALAVGATLLVPVYVRLLMQRSRREQPWRALVIE